MLTEKRNVLWIWFLPVVFLCGMSAWAQITPSDRAYKSTSSGSTASKPARFNRRSALVLTASSAVNDDAAHDKIKGADFTSDGIKEHTVKVVAGPSSASNNLPATLTVKTSALLELHGMRQSAVSLCLELPAKYRTRLRECADIFRHEIRLKALGKERQ
ncbi:MAG: hypothetical protein ACXVKL_16265 [Candidatus Angelobacter sp.]